MKKENADLSSPTGGQGASPGRHGTSLRIFLIGFMGCGKTYWGQQLSAKLHIPFFDLDEKLVEKEGKPITEIFEEGEEYFRLLEKDVLHLLTENHESFVMACGGGTPCFYNNIDYMKAKGITVWINCSVDCLHERLVKERSARPLVKDFTEEALRSYIIKKGADRKIFYQQAAVILTEDEFSLDALTQKIFHS
ncbi:MAG TPA: shikimate kinase [Flavisolibacter sp.]|jgi:shikimate kinase|nr:shikimate kinase [Flavisolibacter sp.]